MSIHKIKNTETVLDISIMNQDKLAKLLSENKYIQIQAPTFLIIRKGSVQLLTEKFNTRCNESSLIFFEHGYIYKINKLQNDVELYLISFPLLFLEQISYKYNTLNSYFIFKCNLEKILSVTKNQIEELVFLTKSIQSILENSELHASNLLKLINYQFICFAHSVADFCSSNICNHQHNSRTEIIILNFLRDLEMNVCEQKCVSFYANKQQLSVRYLSQIVKHSLGKSASQLIQDYLIKEAIYLLEQKNNGIADIADKIGFSDSNSFNHFFKRIIGLSPTIYRKNFIANKK